MRAVGLTTALLLAGCAADAPLGELESQAQPLLQASAEWTRYGLDAGDAIRARKGPFTDLDGDGLPELIVNSPNRDGVDAGAGTCHVFAGQSGGPSPLEVWTLEGDGVDVSLRCWPAGDVDGDGYGDILTAEPYRDGVFAGSGRAALYCGDSSYPSHTPCWEWEPEQAGATLYWATSVGDLNGDSHMDVALIASGWDDAFVDEGAVFVFLGTGSGLPATPDWEWFCGEADCVISGVWSAGDVDADGYDELLVGLSGFDGAFSSQGRVELFAGSFSGPAATPSWSRLGEADLFRLGQTAGGVGDVDGDGFADFAVGAFGGVDGRGEVIVYAGGDLATLGATLLSTESDTVNGHRFVVGPAVDLDRDGYSDVLLGEPGRVSESDGVAMVFAGGPSGPATNPTWEFNGPPGDTVLGLGRHLQLLGDPEGQRSTVAVSHSGDSQAGSEAGAVFGHLANRPMPSDVAEPVVYEPNTPLLGRFDAAAEPGDFNGDGFDDLVVATRYWPDQTTDRGRVEVRYGSASGAGGVGWEAEGLNDGDRFGQDYGIGDIDGDGYQDLVVSAPAEFAASGNQGVVRAWFGGPAGLDAVEGWTVEGPASDAPLGRAVTVADENCDGYGDVALSVNDGSWQVAVYRSDAGVLPSTPTSTLAEPSTVAFGRRMAWGDFNGDGCADLAVGDAYFVVSPAAEGKVFVYHGGVAGWGVLGDSSSGDTAGGHYSWWLSAGDIDGDGYTDIVSASAWPSTDTEGQVQVDYGSASGLGGRDTLTVPGAWVAGQALPDVDGDGFADVAASGLYSFINVHRGGASGVEPSHYWGRTSHAVVAGVGDYNGDGFGDVVGFNWNTIDVFEGNAFNGHAPISTRPRILDLDGSPLAIGNRADSAAFEVFWPDARLARGPSWMRMQVEAKPSGTLFDGQGLLSTDWAHQPAPADLSLVVDGLDSDTAYHWRARLQPIPAHGATVPNTRWYYGDPLHPQGIHLRTAADGDGDGYIGDDCDDGDASINPGATELCDDVDQDCDGQVDEDFDVDGDGALTDQEPDCVALVGAAATDCDDADATAFPSATETCDGDLEACGSAVDFGFDQDGDGAFDAGDGGCLAAYGSDADCDDTDSLVHPGAAEGCDGIDTDCDSSLGSNETDDDLDGQTECAGDCDDAVATTYSGASELCNAVDDDCDSLVDAADPDTDVDGDGYSVCEDDCDDNNAAAWPGAAEVCADGLDTDCNNSLVDHFADTDGDGIPDCLDPDADNDNFASIPAGGTDCDDLDFAVNPGADELCDGMDTDCDGVVPADEVDVDGDGFVSCANWEGSGPLDEGDCDNADAAIHPGADEGCDGVDTDCDGAPDPEEVDGDGDGVAECEGDCDDADAAVYPSAAEACTGVDDDCDGLTDDDDPDTDADGDGFGLCDDPADCDDADDATWPGAEETCDDNVDTNCDGSRVDTFLDTDGDGTPDCVDTDADGDGFASIDEGGGDCDDTAPTVHPGATELCDGLDNDCTEGVPGDEVDGDGDGFVPCGPWVGDSSLSGGDCVDGDAAIFPTAPELCDGLDQNCDGVADEDLVESEWFADGDGDGFGDGDSPHADNPGCDPGEGWVDNADDCDDRDAEAFPGGTEVEGNRVDEDCDGVAANPPSDDAPALIIAPGIACSSAGPAAPLGGLLILFFGWIRRRS